MQEGGSQRPQRSAAPGRLSLALSLLGLAGLIALVAVTLGLRPGQRARAVLDSSVNMSISSTGCSSGTPAAKCTVSAGGTFTVNFNVGALPSTGSYAGYDLDIRYTGGVSYMSGSLLQMGAGVWPDCAFPAGAGTFTTGRATTGCAVAVGAMPSTYFGVMAKLGFTCSSSGTITLVHGDTHTDLTDAALTAHSEAADESLTINCLAPTPTITPGGPTLTPTPTITPGGPTLTPTPTITPGGPTLTPTPTITPGGPTLTPTAHAPTVTPTPSATGGLPTATRTPAGTPTATPRPAGQAGDANKDGRVNVIDAQLILQYAAGLIGSINPNADANRDGRTNVIDAQLILQLDAGLISHF